MEHCAVGPVSELVAGAGNPQPGHRLRRCPTVQKLLRRRRTL